MSKTVLTLTVNPAIDRIVTVDRLVFEDRAYILSTTESAGGRGINAARVLTNFGAKVLAITTIGPEKQRTFGEQLKQDGFETDLVKIRNNIRTNLTISDRQGLSVKLNELGPSLSESEQTKVLKTVKRHLSGASWLMLCGSVPPDVDKHLYTKLIRMASQAKVQTLLDTDGDALLHGIEGSPTIVTPNQSEAERLLNRALLTRSHYIDAVKSIKSMGPKYAVLSLGSRGAVAASDEGVFEVVAPRVEALCPIGAGDALAAATVWAMESGEAFPAALRWGVAAGTASARLPGINLATLEQTREVHSRTQLTQIT